MQIWEDHNFKVPLDVIDSELDKFFSSSNLRNLKEVDTWLIAFQEFYVPKLKKKLKWLNEIYINWGISLKIWFINKYKF